MTSTAVNSLTLMADELAENALTKQQRETLREERAQVRQRFAAAYSLSPLYRAAAAQDPEFWDKCSIGHGSWSGMET